LKALESVKVSVKEEDMDDFLDYNKPALNVEEDLEDLENQDEDKDKIKPIGTMADVDDPLTDVFNEIKGNK
jgi:hypothetical protein